MADQEAVQEEIVSQIGIARRNRTSLISQLSSLDFSDFSSHGLEKEKQKQLLHRSLTDEKIHKEYEDEDITKLELMTNQRKQSTFIRRALQQVRGSSDFLPESLEHSEFSIHGVAYSNQSRLQRLMKEMAECIRSLEGKVVSDDDLEYWACLVYESMSASSRTFHSVQHIFDVSKDKDEIQKLCAFFHDCIYYSVDGGLSAQQTKILDGIIDETYGGVYLQKAEFDVETEMVTKIFGFTKGQKLNPLKGLNEYLSAVMAARCYTKSLNMRHLAEIVVCIEATIPFRSGEPMELLFSRLQAVNQQYDLNLTEAELIKAVQRSADFGNTDVANFALRNRAVYLSNTWNLLPESNISLRHNGVFRISDFTLALQKMTNFFTTLRAETIFTSFRDEPSEEVISELTKRAADNIEIALKYMHCKQLSIAVLSAFAVLTGGDAPIALFLGDLPEAAYISPSVEDLIDVTIRREGIGMDDTVFALLKEGREKESKFDIKKSPMAALLYANIGDSGVKAALKHVAQQPMDEEHAKHLLMSLPKECIIEIGIACSSFATTRSTALKHIVTTIQKGCHL